MLSKNILVDANGKLVVHDNHRFMTESIMIKDIQITYSLPPPGLENGRIALWLPDFYLGPFVGTEVLLRLSEFGFFSFSVTSWLSRSRDGAKNMLSKSISSNFKSNYRTIFAINALNLKAIIDWVTVHFKLKGPVVIGGFGAGADIAFILSEIDERIVKIATIGLTSEMKLEWNLLSADIDAFPDLLSSIEYKALKGAMHFCSSLLQNRYIQIELGISDNILSSAKMKDFINKLSIRYHLPLCNIQINQNKPASFENSDYFDSLLNKIIEFLVQL